MRPLRRAGGSRLGRPSATACRARPPALQAKPKSGVVVGTPIGKALALLRSLYQYGVPLLGVFFIVIMFVMMS